jgi:hypothetical protein
MALTTTDVLACLLKNEIYMRASSEVSTSGLYVYAFDPALLICTRIKISGERPDFYLHSDLTQTNSKNKNIDQPRRK